MMIMTTPQLCLGRKMLAAITISLLLLGALPLSWWLSCVAMALRARATLGRWPVVGDTGPPTSALELIPGLFLVGLVPALMLMRRTNSTSWIPVAVVALGLLWLIGFAVVIIDPGGVVIWILN